MNAPVLLVTGGSRGIGAATALLAAQAGYAVAVNYQSNSLAADEVVRSIRDSGGQAMALQADVSREDEVMAMFARLDAKWGPLAALVNNAGVVDVSSRVDAMGVARLSRMLNTHVLGSFVCAREAVLRMSTRHGGAGGGIVNLSSAASKMGSPGQYVDYAACKGAIDTFTIGLAKEVASLKASSARPGRNLEEDEAATRRARHSTPSLSVSVSRVASRVARLWPYASHPQRQRVLVQARTRDL
jgi:NAD(P)-dependent dehydrogenase (short-subunit alcohol dehydrogenase family)